MYREFVSRHALLITIIYAGEETATYRDIYQALLLMYVYAYICVIIYVCLRLSTYSHLIKKWDTESYLKEHSSLTHVGVVY